MRLLAVALGAIVLAFAALGCSSSSNSAKKSPTPATPLTAATFLPNGTVVVHGTPIAGAARTTAVAAATSIAAGGGGAVPPGVTPLRSTVAGTPNASGTAVPGSTAAPGATSAVPPRTAPAGQPTDVAPTAAAVAPSDGFLLDLPASATGDFQVTVRLAAPPPYHGVSVSLAFDASLLSVQTIAPGDVTSGSNWFCVPPQIQPGSASLACTPLGPDNVTNGGTVAVFHFHALHAGTTNLHFVTYAEGGAETGSYLVGSNADSPVPVTVPLHDANVTVAP